jgi:hypothetical protein
VPEIAFGEVAPSVLFILPAGWTLSGSTVTTPNGSIPLFPDIPTQYSRFPEGWSYKGISAPAGREAFLFTDNTVRDNAGRLLGDLTALGDPPLSFGGGKTSRDVLRQGGRGTGSPLVMGQENVNVSAGVPPEMADTARQLGYDLFDPGNAGGRLYAVRPEPPFSGDINLIPSDWTWLWSDGTIRTFTGALVSGTPRPLPTVQVDFAPQPEGSVYYNPPPVNDGTRGSARAPEGAYIGDPIPVTNDGDPVPVMNRPIPGTVEPSPGNLPDMAVAGTGPGVGSAASPPASVFGLPWWAWAVAAVVILKRKG